MFMYILDLNLCEEPGVLTVFLVMKIVITIIKILVPLLVIFNCFRQLFPLLMNGESPSKVLSPIFKSLIASFVIFIIPSVLNYVFISLSDYSVDSYSSCVIDANPETIKALREAQLTGDRDAYNQLRKENYANLAEDHKNAVERYRQLEEERKRQQEQEQQQAGGSNTEASSGGSGNWANSSFPLPSGSTSCRSSVFGPRTHPITGKYDNHSGDDYPAACGTSVYAVMDGKVVDYGNDGGWHGGMGNFVKILHNDGTSSVYMHSSNVLVRTGQTVSKGQEIMKVGTTGSSTGCHLHITIKDQNGNNQAPSNYIPTLKAC